MDTYPRLIKSDNHVIIEINSSPFTLGRASSCNHVMLAENMSRIHCSLEKVSNHWILKDTSTNGTYVNGVWIKSRESRPLIDGDIINFGRRNENYIFHLIPRGSIGDEQQSRISERLPSEIVVQAVPECTTVPASPTDTASIENSPSSVPTEVAGPSNTPQEYTRREEMPKATRSSETENEEELLNEMQCAICSELFIKATTLNCSHTFCQFCIETWRKNKSTCPICRAKITSMNPTLVLNNVIKKVVRNGSEEVKQHRKEVLEDRQKCVEQSRHENIGKDVIRRWTNLRDAFARSKRKMKDSKRNGTDAKKPKKCVYNDQLQFLNKLYDVRHGTENNSEHIEVEANASFTIDETINKRTRNRKHRKPDEVELKILKALEPEKQNSKMSFFHSLLPHLDRFDENELLQFQMGVLQVIANISEKKKMVPQVPPPFPQSIPTHSHSQQFAFQLAFQLAPSFPQHVSIIKIAGNHLE